jgi:hypothetical protein
VQEITHSKTRHAKPLGELDLRDAKRRHYIFAQDLARVRRAPF